jgi:antitoxin (DNA-binding transcriptional repressor) of toxin-antitoxin stability system
MKAIGIRELKNRLSEYIRLVRAGERILVTDRGEVVAELRPPGETLLEDTSYPGLLALVQQGRARLGAPNDPRLYPSRPVRRPGGMAATLIDQERGES